MATQDRKRKNDQNVLSSETPEDDDLFREESENKSPHCEDSVGLGMSITEKRLKLTNGVNAATSNLNNDHDATLEKKALLLDYKVFNDPIHGHIDLHPLCVRIIDTLPFQRMRNIKQLGGTYFVFPGGSHNRFEHCIGTCYLAGVLVRELQQRQPELNITDIDVLCVEIAGLCHDLGHGPFSHAFDGNFIPSVRPSRKWQHEVASIELIDFMLESSPGLKEAFDSYGIDDTNRLFIKEMIAGPLDSHNKSRYSTASEWPYKGRKYDKAFLYEVIANKRTGIDVDKFDYFARDAYQLGLKYNFDHVRYIKFVRVLTVDGLPQICCRDKEVECVYDLFHARHSLHRRAYQHKNKNVVEAMICEAFGKADDYLLFPGKDGKMLKLSETIDDMYAYSRVTDHVLYNILYSIDPRLTPAREVVEKIMRRELYKCIGRTNAPIGQFIDYPQVEEVKRELASYATYMDDCSQQQSMLTDSAETRLATENEPLQPDDFVVHFVRMDYGMENMNPTDNVRFYMKRSPHKPIKVSRDQVSQMLPDKFAEQRITIFCKRSNQATIDLCMWAFVQWCRVHNLPDPRGADVIEAEYTPIKFATVGADGNELDEGSSEPLQHHHLAPTKLVFD